MVSLASSGYTTGATDSPASLSVSVKVKGERGSEGGREGGERERERTPPQACGIVSTQTSTIRLVLSSSIVASTQPLFCLSTLTYLCVN